MKLVRGRRRLGLGGSRRYFVGALAIGALLLAGSPAAFASTFERRPVLFVHGVESAGSNFASQEMRFESNGYPHAWVEALDYNSLGAAAENYNGEVEEQIEKAIAGLKQRSGKSQVVVVGHSEGTKVMYHYLAESAKAAEHRASVAAYVNLDGQEKNPGVRTLAVWAERSVGSSVAAAGSACAANAASASPTSAPSTQPRSVLIAFPSLRLAPGRAPDQDVRGPLCVAANRSTFLGLRNSAAPPRVGVCA